MSGIAERYSVALVGAARERGVSDEVEQDARGILAVIEESDDLRSFIENPFVLPEQKAAVYRGLLEGKVNAITLSFLLLLCERRRDRFVGDILSEYLVRLERERGLVTADVRSAIPLSEDQQARLSERLSQYTGRQVRLSVDVDPSLKAGFVAQIEDQVLDGTLGSMLNRIHRQLRAGS